MNSMLTECLEYDLTDEAQQDAVLLLVGAVEDDDSRCGSVFSQFTWQTQRARSYREALPLIRQGLHRVVVSERDLPDGNWKDILELASARKEPPAVVVTSRLADDHLWAEVLNLGGYDVLAKPLNRTEVYRVINLAWQHGVNRIDMAPKACRVGK